MGHQVGGTTSDSNVSCPLCHVSSVLVSPLVISQLKMASGVSRTDLTPYVWGVEQIEVRGP